MSLIARYDIDAIFIAKLTYIMLSLCQIVVGSFVPNGFKTQKRKYNTEPKVAPTVQCAPATVTAATPLSQAPPGNTNIFPVQTPQFVVQTQGEADHSLSTKDLPNSASTDNTADWNGSSDQRPYPDINISLPVEEH